MASGPLQVFVGAGSRQALPTAVLAHSIRSRASVDVVVTPLTSVDAPTPRDRRNWPRTDFSFARFAIPELCGFEGRAVYLDSDMLVFADVAELLHFDLGSAAIACTSQPEPPAQWRGHPGFQSGRQLSVMLLDCARARFTVADAVRGLDEGHWSYEELMHDLPLLPPEEIRDDLDPAWNCLEHYEPGSSKLTHFTVEPTQPWRVTSNPLTPLWEDALRAAVADGAVPPDLVRREVRRGNVRASLLPTLGLPEARGAAGMTLLRRVRDNAWGRGVHRSRAPR